MLFLNQPVLATEENISSDRVRFEYLDNRIAQQSERWVPIATDVTLEANETYTLTLPVGSYTVIYRYMGYETVKKEIALTRNSSLCMLKQNIMYVSCINMGSVTVPSVNH